jgi:hypothetical protein
VTPPHTPTARPLSRSVLDIPRGAGYATHPAWETLRDVRLPPRAALPRAALHAATVLGAVQPTLRRLGAALVRAAPETTVRNAVARAALSGLSAPLALAALASPVRDAVLRLALHALGAALVQAALASPVRDAVGRAAAYHGV